MGFVSFFKIIQGTSIDLHFQICSQISPFLNIYKFDHGHMATSNISSLTVHWYLRGVNYSPSVKLIAEGHKSYMGLYSEIFRNLKYGYQFYSFLGILCFKPIPKYCNVWYEGILRISQWSNTGPSWPSFFDDILLYQWRGHQTTPTVVSLKGRLPQIMQSKSAFSCEIVLIHSLFRHSFINKPKSENWNRKGHMFVL